MTTQVKDVMTRAPYTIDPDAPIETATAVMRERGVRHLPVVDDTGKLLGMVSDRDVRDAVFAPAFAERLSASARRRLRSVAGTLENLKVKDVMTWGGMTTEPDALLAQAAAVMFEGRIGSLAVVQKGRLVGIVTERDVLRALALTLTPVRGVDPDTYLW
jgi:acetoin utilization protein AcuB